MEGCLDGSRTSQSDPEWSVGDEWRNALLSTAYRRDTPWPMSGIPVTVTPMSESYASEVVAGAGATKPVRDSIDALGISLYESGGGYYVRDVSYPGDFPAFSAPSSPTDNDNDGMADSWETSTFGNLQQEHDGDQDSDGYTNIEEYLFLLGGYEDSGPIPCIDVDGDGYNRSGSGCGPVDCDDGDGNVSQHLLVAVLGRAVFEKRRRAFAEVVGEEVDRLGPVLHVNLVFEAGRAEPEIEDFFGHPEGERRV